jgi:Flp pilus assembly protein TadG
MAARGGRERGSVTLETVIVFPLVLLIFFGALQAGFWFHARNTCMAAAQEGARVGAVMGGSQAGAVQVASDFLVQAANGLVTSPTVTANRGATEIVVVVEAEGLSIVPGFPVKVKQTARLPVERIT